jgi:hypothetical protein
LDWLHAETPGPSVYRASLAALGQRKRPDRNQPLLVGRTEYYANRAEREFMASSLALCGVRAVGWTRATAGSTDSLGSMRAGRRHIFACGT